MVRPVRRSSFQTSLSPLVARERGGALVVEMLLAITILLLCTMALVQWTFTAFCVQAVNSAASEGARTAAAVFPSDPARETRVEATVVAVLQPLGFDDTQVTVTVGPLTAGTYQVTVEVPISACPIPLLLENLGLSLTGKSLTASSLGWAS
jgi:Flp pilus assembly protein TadG